MATIAQVKNQIQSLIDSANAKTSQASADLTSAVNVLIEGYGTGSGGGGTGGSLPAGAYYEGLGRLPKNHLNHGFFTLNGDTYLWTVTGTNKNAQIYKYENRTYTLVCDVPSDVASVLGLSIKCEFIEFKGKVFIRMSSKVATWDGTNFVLIGDVFKEGSNTRASDNNPGFVVQNGELYYCYVSSSIFKFKYDETANTFTYIGYMFIESSLNGMSFFNVGEGVFGIGRKHLVAFNLTPTNTEFTIMFNNLFPYNVFPEDVVVDGTMIYFAYNNYTASYGTGQDYLLYKGDLVTQEIKTYRLPAYIQRLFLIDGQLNMTIRGYSDYNTQVITHIIE